MDFYSLPQHVAERKNGRYKLPHPVTGAETAFTSVTTFCKFAESENPGLERWRQRHLVRGIALRRDLYALACATQPTASQALDSLCWTAMQAGAVDEAANLGTAIHSMTEAIDRGATPLVPEELEGDLDSYQRALSEGGVVVLPEYLERVVYVPGYELVGRLDKIVRYEGSTYPQYRSALMVADLKTGKTPEKKGGSFAIQLACYANASHMWDEYEGVWREMPDVSRDVGLIMSSQVGAANCRLAWSNLRAGWEQGAALCQAKRDWSKNRNLLKFFV